MDRLDRSYTHQCLQQRPIIHVVRRLQKRMVFIALSTTLTKHGPVQAEDDWAMDLLTVLCSARESQGGCPPHGRKMMDTFGEDSRSPAIIE